MGQSSFQYAAASDWNNLPRALREMKTLSLWLADRFFIRINKDFIIIIIIIIIIKSEHRATVFFRSDAITF